MNQSSTKQIRDIEEKLLLNSVDKEKFNYVGIQLNDNHVVYEFFHYLKKGGRILEII